VAAAVVPQRLQRHVEADLVPELEAVGDSLGRAEDTDSDPVDLMLLYARAQRVARHPGDAQ